MPTKNVPRREYWGENGIAARRARSAERQRVGRDGVEYVRGLDHTSYHLDCWHSPIGVGAKMTEKLK